MPYDTDFIFDEHFCWTSSKSDKISLIGKDLTPILNNRLVEECLRDINNKYAPIGDISYLNMIRSETVQSLQKLMVKLCVLHKDQRNSISLIKVALNTIFTAVLLAVILVGYDYLSFSSKSLNFGLYPVIAYGIEVTDIVIERSLLQLNGNIDFEMWLYLSVILIPVMALMKLFGRNKALSSRRMLK